MEGMEGDKLGDVSCELLLLPAVVVGFICLEPWEPVSEILHF